MCKTVKERALSQKRAQTRKNPEKHTKTRANTCKNTRKHTKMRQNTKKKNPSKHGKKRAQNAQKRVKTHKNVKTHAKTRKNTQKHQKNAKNCVFPRFASACLGLFRPSSACGNVMKVSSFLRLDWRESIRANHPDLRRESSGHLSSTSVDVCVCVYVCVCAGFHSG